MLTDLTSFFSRAILPVLLFISLGGCLLPHASSPVTGTLHGEVHWSGEVRLAGDVILAENSILQIAPGTTVLFLSPEPGQDLLVDHPHFPGSELIIRGTLVAEGTSEAPIVFRHFNQEAPPGSWGGVNLQQSPRAIFRYCIFTQADSALHSQESKVMVTESVFEGNRVGIRFHTSEIRIEHNRIHGNGTGIRFHFGAPVILANEISENGKGIFITSHPRDFRIEGNNITGQRQFTVVLGEEVPEAVPMPGNWWGTDDSARILSSFFDRQRADYIGPVEILPVAAEPIAGAGISWTP